MKQETFSIQDAIIDKETFEDFQCQICYSIALVPTECCGPCRKKFCTKCVSDWKMMQDRCPIKCSDQGFFVRTVKPPSVSFRCQFNPSMCPTVLSSIQKFQEHFQRCEFISPTQKRQKLLKKEGKCFNQHELEFFLGTYEEMCESKCSSCGQIKLCRLICRKCNQLYCVYCRPPKCSKKSCPLGHKFNYQQYGQIGYICDLCGISTAITNNGVYDDSLCNFGLCEECYKNLPNECEVNENKTRNPFTCSQGHDLVVDLPQKEMRKCFNCEKMRYCPKVCRICLEVYCLNCRIGIVQEGKLCLKGHQLIYQPQKFQLQKKDYPEQISDLHPHYNSHFPCLKCSSLTHPSYHDPYCNFSLCQPCFQYQNRILDNKNRFIQSINCSRGHQLRFYSGQSECIQQCFGCKKNSVIKLFCNYCPLGERSYCCHCKNMEMEAHRGLCYFGHGLEVWKSLQVIHCNICMDVGKQFWRCAKCNYFVCDTCYEGKEIMEDESEV